MLKSQNLLGAFSNLLLDVALSTPIKHLDAAAACMPHRSFNRIPNALPSLLCHRINAHSTSSFPRNGTDNFTAFSRQMRTFGQLGWQGPELILGRKSVSDSKTLYFVTKCLVPRDADTPLHWNSQKTVCKTYCTRYFITQYDVSFDKRSFGYIPQLIL